MSRFIICKASAGSGKTYTLVRQYIETAISSPSQLEHRFEHILAITFTNKAANGMKERIMKQLHALAEGGAYDLCKEMAEQLSVTEEEVRRRCAVVQSAILHHYSELSVCTIDSFVHRLVRTFAHDLKLPVNFDLLIENQQIIQSSVDELLALAGAEKQEALTKVLCAYTESRMDSGNSYRLDKQITELTKEIFKEGTMEYQELLEKVSMEDFIELDKRLRQECRKVEQQLSAAALELMAAVAREGLAIDDFSYKRSGALAMFIRLAEDDYSKLNEPHVRADDAYNKSVLWSKSTPAEVKSRMEALMPEYRKAYETVTEILDKELVGYNTRQLLLRNLFGLALLGKLGKIKNDYYKENEKVHISEFNKRIAEEVMDEPAPFIYERIGSRYYNYMIDEFQDTSRLQWLNFLPLLDEAMTHQFSSDTALPGTQSLVVGDGKQAIYRFRQGDVRQFMRLPQVDSKLHGRSLAHNAEMVSLKKNFRTMRNIVEFNNRFFETSIRDRFVPSEEGTGNPELAKLYLGDGEKAELVQEAVKEGGYVQVSFSDRDSILQSILDTIRHQVDDLGYSYGDIMVLAREKDTLVEISDYISANSNGRAVPVVSSESFLLSGCAEVQLMRSLLEYIYDPKNRLAALTVVRLYCADGEWELRDSGFDLEKMMDKLLPHEEGHHAFDVRWLRALPLYDICETLIRLFNLDGKGNRFMLTFLNVVNNYVQNGGTGLGDFISYLDERMEKLSSATASDLDAVQLMTIHKAKGLESKIVIYAMPDKKSPNNKIWVEVKDAAIICPRGHGRTGDAEQIGLPVAFVEKSKAPTLFKEAFDEEARLTDMDRINILYVAMTRPEEKLFVFGEDSSASDETTNNLALLRKFVNSDAKVTNHDGLYTVGEDFACPKRGEKEENSVGIGVPTILFPEWENRVSIAQQSAAILSPLDEDNRRYGILIHDILSRIRVVEDVDKVIDSYCKENELPDSVRDDIRGRITTMIEKEENRRFFDGSCPVKCEASMVVGGKVKRPDRIVFAENETFVVDFKSGAYDERSHNQYQRQVEEYANALTSMGYPHVKPVIVYV